MTKVFYDVHFDGVTKENYMDFLKGEAQLALVPNTLLEKDMKQLKVTITVEEVPESTNG
jgi:hypothetical protein